MIQVPTTREREARYGQLWKQLWTRLLGTDIPECQLRSEPLSWQNGRCSTCTVKLDLDIDHSVAHLITHKIVACPARCPYVVFAAALINALLVGPGAEETARDSEQTRIIELKAALKHIDRALKTLSPRREDLEYLAVRGEDELFVRLHDVVKAETLIAEAVKFFIENVKRNYGEGTDLTKPRPPRRGRPGALELQGIVSACDDAWTQLIGKKPGKNNVNFHAVLQAAATTVLGPLDPEPDWEWQIVAARKRESGWKSGQKSGD
jgi:hypothetical protein